MLGATALAARRPKDMRMHTPSSRGLSVVMQHLALTVTLCTLASIVHSRIAWGAPPSHQLVAYLEDRLGLSEPQVRGALGALLVFARDRLPQPEFNEFADRIPNAEQIMRETKQRGVVTRSLDTLDDYEATLSNLDIGQPTASRIAPAVLEWLGAEGYDKERDMLARVLD
jgi:hypothetical protein